MCQPKQLLPSSITHTDYDALRGHVDLWPEVMQVICQQHGLATERLVRLGDGTNIVFTVGENRVIKLYPPYWRRLWEAELTVAEHVFGKLRISTPEIEASGLLDEWPYLVMSRLPGVYLSDIWDTLEQANQLSLVIELAEIVAQLHALPTNNLPHLNANWPKFVATRISGCLQRHREQGVSEQWLQQIPSYLAHAAPLYPPNFTPAIISGDIHGYHLLVQQEHGRWRLSGLFDFDDALLGFHEYDLAATVLFLMAGRSDLLRPFLLTYGYAEADLNEALRHRLMAYTLLHRYRPFNWVREDFVKQSCDTLEEMAGVIYSLE
jgi:hygromycin-B 7''-O-kinase